MAPFFRLWADAVAQATEAQVEVIEVVNDFYGSSVTTAGLLAGTDLRASLESGASDGDVCLIPAEALNADDLFIDSYSLSELRAALAPALVVPGYDLIDALHDAAEALSSVGIA